MCGGAHRDAGGAAGIEGRAGGDTGPYGRFIGCPIDAGRTGAQCAPLHTIGRAAGVGRTGGHRPPLQPVYQHHQQTRRHLPHRASEATIKSRRQVVATQAERQRTPTTNPKTRGTLSGHLYLCESHRRRVRSTKLKIKHRSVEGASRPMVLRGERIRAVPPKGG